MPVSDMSEDDPEYKSRVRRVRTRLIAAQTIIRKDRRVAFALVVNGDDRRGIHRLTNRLFEWMDARYMDARVHGRPTNADQGRPQLMRLWRDAPSLGRGAVFVRSAAHRILADRVRGRIKRAAFENRLRHLRNLETVWSLENIKVVKLWLTVPPDVHARRRESRNDLDRWRSKQVDRALLQDLEKGGEVAAEVRQRTDAPHAPWHVIDGQSGRERDLAAAEIIADALEEAVAGASPAIDVPEVPAVPAEVETRVADLLDPALLTDAGPNDEEYHDRLRRLRGEITERALDALRDERPTVVVMEGWDAAGKGGAIRRAIPALDHAFYRAISVGPPSPVEHAHPYLWRFWRDLPQPGHIRFFDRSWYGRVLVERVEGFATANEWKRAYDEILDFEEQLVEAGTNVIKVWLAISEAEQLRRFEAREGTPEKQHKIGPEDWRNREKRREYELAVREMIARTHQEWAPWNVIGAENKRSGRLRFLEVLRDGLG